MICQGSGGGYGDVLERDPELVMKDLREDPMSHENAHDIYKVVYDQVNLVVDVEATAELRAAERRQRTASGNTHADFVAESSEKRRGGTEGASTWLSRGWPT